MQNDPNVVLTPKLLALIHNSSCFIIPFMVFHYQITCASRISAHELMKVIKHIICKVIAYVKDKGAQLNTLKNALTNIVSCVPLMLPQSYASSYYVWTCYDQMLSICYKSCESLWSHEGGINQRCINIFVKNYYMDK
jgi:hypothetical protein